MSDAETSSPVLMSRLQHVLLAALAMGICAYGVYAALTRTPAPTMHNLSVLLRQQKYREAEQALFLRAEEGRAAFADGRLEEAQQIFAEVRQRAAEARAYALRHPRPPHPRTLAIDEAAQRANPVSPPARTRDPDEVRFAAREADAAASVAMTMLAALEEQKKAESNEGGRPPLFTPEEAEPIEKELQLALERDPLQENAYLLLGWLYDRCGLLQKAAEALEKCLALNDRRADAYNRLGLVRIKQERHAEAFACFEKALLFSQGEGQAYRDSLYNLGAAHEALRAGYLNSSEEGDKAAARAAAEKHRQEAIRHWRAFLESEPSSPFAAKVREHLRRLEDLD
mgnify:CR=1 FL=1